MKKIFLALVMLGMGLAIVAGQALAGGSNTLNNELVSGQVDPVNTLTLVSLDTSVTPLNLDSSGQGNVITFQVNNNYEKGWKLTMTSQNLGQLVRSAPAIGATDGSSVQSGILYSPAPGTIGAVGTLGNGITTFTGDGDIHTLGGLWFATVGTATSATVGYQISFAIQWGSNSAKLEGLYQDLLTLTLSPQP